MPEKRRPCRKAARSSCGRTSRIQGAEEKKQDKGAGQDTLTGPGKIIPEANLGQAQAKIQGCKWEIDQAQVEGRRESVAFARFDFLHLFGFDWSVRNCGIDVDDIFIEVVFGLISRNTH